MDAYSDRAQHVLLETGEYKIVLDNTAELLKYVQR